MVFLCYYAEAFHAAHGCSRYSRRAGSPRIGNFILCLLREEGFVLTDYFSGEDLFVQLQLEIFIDPYDCRA
ncbi:hypothetical protein CEXT_709601 [Caerostris extrusa]|uniref:Maturase K n=1 Tax=Caerostris extrusa TaxID=172846 RepID=A0AAV4VJV2_CAEEX|nr:hypothetical protein CEXT_709601 [Caerostris extrusa]